MVFNIAICDDDIQQCSFIENVLLDCPKGRNELFQIEVFYRGEELCEHIENGEFFDIIFLDIELERVDWNGIDIGKWIRNGMRNNSIRIIYISSFYQYVWDAFQVSALNFLRKPFTEEDILRALQQGIQQIYENERTFEFKEGWEYKKVLYEDILYLQRQGKKVEVVTVYEKSTFYGSLEKTFEKLHPQNFFYANRSCIINLFHVTKFDYNSITLLHKYDIPIVKGKYKELRRYQELKERNVN